MVLPFMNNVTGRLLLAPLRSVLLLALLLAAALALGACTGQTTAQGWAGPLPLTDSTVLAFTDIGRLISLDDKGLPKPLLDANGNQQVDSDRKPLFLSFPPTDQDPLNASYSTPVLTQNGNLILTVRLSNQRNSAVVSLDNKTLKDIWSFSTYRDKAWDQIEYGRINDDLVIVGNMVYIASLDHNLYALDVSTGNSAWDRAYNASNEL